MYALFCTSSKLFLHKVWQTGSFSLCPPPPGIQRCWPLLWCTSPLPSPSPPHGAASGGRSSASRAPDCQPPRGQPADYPVCSGYWPEAALTCHSYTHTRSGPGWEAFSNVDPQAHNNKWWNLIWQKLACLFVSYKSCILCIAKGSLCVPLTDVVMEGQGKMKRIPRGKYF